jgi:hypothetical protein
MVPDAAQDGVEGMAVMTADADLEARVAHTLSTLAEGPGITLPKLHQAPSLIDLLPSNWTANERATGALQFLGDMIQRLAPPHYQDIARIGLNLGEPPSDLPTLRQRLVSVRRDLAATAGSSAKLGDDEAVYETTRKMWDKARGKLARIIAREVAERTGSPERWIRPGHSATSRRTPPGYASLGDGSLRVATLEISLLLDAGVHPESRSMTYVIIPRDESLLAYGGIVAESEFDGFLAHEPVEGCAECYIGAMPEGTPWPPYGKHLIHPTPATYIHVPSLTPGQAHSFTYTVRTKGWGDLPYSALVILPGGQAMNILYSSDGSELSTFDRGGRPEFGFALKPQFDIENLILELRCTRELHLLQFKDRGEEIVARTHPTMMTIVPDGGFDRASEPPEITHSTLQDWRGVDVDTYRELRYRAEISRPRRNAYAGIVWSEIP